MSDHQADTSLTNVGVEYEKKDIRIGWLAGAAFVILILTVAAMLLVSVFLNGLQTRQATVGPTPLPLSGAQPTPPAPRLQPNVLDRTTAEQDMMMLREQENEILNSYGWVDEEAGLVRVPIDRAIELLTLDEGVEEAPER